MSLRIDIELGTHRYPIWIGPGLLTDPDIWSLLPNGGRVLLVSDDHVAPLYADTLATALPVGLHCHRHVIQAGETGKNLDQYAAVLRTLAEMQARRDATIVALGGGVVGDLAGFAAASWMRGVRYVQAPTTLLAMVDSSVGGKTGINLAEGKNLVGAFHQPAAVIADTDTLATLPARELAAGLAEVVKYAAIGDPAFMDWLESNAVALLEREPAALAHAIATSVRHKVAVVSRDERERGERALLNLGHTFGHAIEAATNYRRYLHGEAVAIGMVQAARLSARLGLAPVEDGERLARLLGRLGLATRPEPDLAPEELLRLMRLDKKATGDGLRFILWRGIGQAFIADDIHDSDVLATLADG